MQGKVHKGYFYIKEDWEKPVVTHDGSYCVILSKTKDDLMHIMKADITTDYIRVGEIDGFYYVFKEKRCYLS